MWWWPGLFERQTKKKTHVLGFKHLVYCGSQELKSPLANWSVCACTRYIYLKLAGSIQKLGMYIEAASCTSSTNAHALSILPIGTNTTINMQEVANVQCYDTTTVTTYKESSEWCWLRDMQVMKSICEFVWQVKLFHTVNETRDPTRVGCP